MNNLSYLAFKKAVDVYNSCNTEEQRRVARKYFSLFLNKFSKTKTKTKFYKKLFKDNTV